jgi:hypothetical protein
MNTQIHHLLSLRIIASVVGVAAGALFFTAGDAPLSGPEICARRASEASVEAPFLVDIDAAMKKMMTDMAIRPVGDVDADFVAMMVPHHKGAIDMAIAVLRYGRNEQVKRLAQAIIVTQQEEIAVMRLAVGEALPPSQPAPDQVPSARRTDVKLLFPADRTVER